MPRFHTGRRSGLVALAAAALAVSSAAVVTTGPADAAPAAVPGATGAMTAVSVFMKAPHPAALAKLAGSAMGSSAGDRAARLKALSALVPSETARRTVMSQLTADGFTLGHESTWSVAASAPASVVASVFGVRPSGADVPLSVAAGALPRIPASLASVVMAVYPTIGGPAPFHASATSTLDGTDYRNADTPAGVKPSTGTQAAQNTVATLQLSDVPASDITTYATDHKLPDPVAAGTYKPVTVDGGPGATDSAGENSIEVDLDQESILSTAPSAHQAPYFAPNTDAGFNDVFADVYDDAVGNKMATSPDPHLTSLSSSWGECEGLYGKANIDPLVPIVESVVAAGVTVFASSGDDGIYDCRSTTGIGIDNAQADVDIPASIPYVVSTGGSNLAADTSAPNTGTNWKETTWSCTDTSSCENGNTGTGGGGGGASGSAFGHLYATATPPTTSDFPGFPAPLWQQKTLTGVYAHAKTRLVPDIAADGDPASGFDVYTSAGTGATGENLTVGGTSLASPISAAQLANTLGDVGIHHGVGDIHAALYSASKLAGSVSATSAKQPLRDITTGQIGADGDKGTDPSVSAAKGFDTTSGVGGVLWSGMLPYLLDTAAPTPSGSLKVSQRAAGQHAAAKGKNAKYTLRLHWTTARGKDTLVYNTTSVVVKRVGSSTPVFTASALNGNTRTVVPRGTYKMTLVSSDIGNNVSKATTVTLVVPKATHNKRGQRS